jgi:segregation and condensation protein B
MNQIIEELVKIIEAYVFSAGMPVTENHIKHLFPEEQQPTTADVRQALNVLKEHYQDRGVVLNEVASGYRFQVADSMAPILGVMWEEKPARYSRALLETLSLIAYRQPITRGEIEDIRGVVVSTQIIKTLLELEWIRSVGHRDVPGRPALYATTREFLDHFNLKNLEDLPSLAQLRDLQIIEQELIEKAEIEPLPTPEAVPELTPEMCSTDNDPSA